MELEKTIELVNFHTNTTLSFVRYLQSLCKNVLELNSTDSDIFPTTLINCVKKPNFPCNTKKHILTTEIKSTTEHRLFRYYIKIMVVNLIDMEIISVGLLRQYNSHTSGYRIFSSIKNQNSMQDSLMGLHNFHLKFLQSIQGLL